MKRDTDTNKWSLPWFRKASLEAKCLWQFVLDHCDDAGVWLADWELASFQVGAPMGEHLLADMGGAIQSIGAGRLRVMGYVESQNSNGLGNSHYHRKIAALIEKHQAATEYRYDAPAALEGSAPAQEKAPAKLFADDPPQAKTKAAKDTSPVRFTFHCGATVTQETLDRLKKNNPAVDVERETERAMDWVKGQKRKTKSVFLFLDNWMGRRQADLTPPAPPAESLPSTEQCAALGMTKAQIDDLIAKRQCAPWPSHS